MQSFAISDESYGQKVHLLHTVELTAYIWSCSDQFVDVQDPENFVKAGEITIMRAKCGRFA